MHLSKYISLLCVNKEIYLCVCFKLSFKVTVEAVKVVISVINQDMVWGILSSFKPGSSLPHSLD